MSKFMEGFHYVYLLKSKTGEHRYVGITNNLKDRLGRHNRGEVIPTARHAPWVIEAAVAFQSKEKAYAYEKYLKSHAGREYSKRHF